MWRVRLLCSCLAYYAFVSFHWSCLSPIANRTIIREYWTNNDHWIDSSVGYCHWKGIECHIGTQSIKAINLGSNNVLGVPPEELFSLLPNLESLSLNSNPLSGFNFYWLERSLRLSELNLDATGLKAIDGIGKAPSLARLSLRNNRLASPFPHELFDIKTLKSLIISYNQLGEVCLLLNNHAYASLCSFLFPHLSSLSVSFSKMAQYQTSSQRDCHTLKHSSSITIGSKEI